MEDQVSCYPGSSAPRRLVVRALLLFRYPASFSQVNIHLLYKALNGRSLLRIGQSLVDDLPQPLATC